MPRKLKVYRTAVGFRDAYVAAPSQAAALKAWGTQKNLFARGSAEEVTDPALMEPALSKPGEVVYQTRGDLQQQVAALGPLPKREPAANANPEPAPTREPRKRTPPKQAPPKPRPSRAELNAAEQAIEALASEQDAAEQDLRARERALAQERTALEKRQSQQLARLERERDRARDAYQQALRAWEP